MESYRKFTGIPKPRCKPIALKPLIERILLLESTNLKARNIETSITISNDQLIIDADEGQITQVLVNLIRNAEQAILPDQHGKIHIKIQQNLDTDKTLIDVCNNGVPISNDLAPHIFIPFFTTKEAGTGIGLSLSRYIMRLHGGNLRHHTSAEGWTVFSMVF